MKIENLQVVLGQIYNDIHFNEYIKSFELSEATI